MTTLAKRHKANKFSLLQSPSPQKEKSGEKKQIDRIRLQLEDEIRCCICFEVPVQAMSLECAGQHISCLQCFVRLRFGTYIICQGGYKARVELQTLHKDKCPVCQASIDLSYIGPNRAYRALVELYKSISPDYVERIKSTEAQFCDCKTIHLDLNSQLKCVNCVIRCPFQESCFLRAPLYALHESNLFSRHLKDCQGVTECFNCHLEVKNCDLQAHLQQHHSWNDFLQEMSDVRALLNTFSFSARFSEEESKQKLLQCWKLFKIFRKYPEN